MSWEKMGKAKMIGDWVFVIWSALIQRCLLNKDRLLQNPNSLVAKVLKEKYFPNGTFLDTPLSKRPSYVWKKCLECENFTQRRFDVESGKWDEY
jgi:hypothetical protein